MGFSALGIRGRLLALAGLNAAALAIVGAVVLLGFGRVEELARTMARGELARVVASADLERSLASASARIALLARSCRDEAADTDWGGFLSTFDDIARRDLDLGLAAEIRVLVPVAASLMEYCQRTRAALARVRGLDARLLSELGVLDALTARAIIEHTLARRDLGHLDQIMLVISGLRETALLAGKRIAGHVSGGGDADRRDAADMLADLEIRAQGFFPASPEMAASRSSIVASLRLLRVESAELFDVLARFDAAMSQALAAKERIALLTQRLDRVSADRARALDADLRAAMDDATRSLAIATVAVVLLSVLLTAWVIRSGIQRPLAAVLRQVESIRRGDLAARPASVRGDEWGRIQSALSTMMGELAEAMNAARSASAAKSQFLAVMSHELRTPMNAIMGLAQVLAAEELDPGRRREYARVIVRSGEALLKILNDILDLSKVEAGRFDLEPVAFRPDALLEEVRALFADIARERNLALEVEWRGPAAAYRADAGRVRQMLSNLVSNALKFTASGSIRIHGLARASTGDDAEAELEFRVVDTGPGMSGEEVAQLFQPFTRLDNTPSRHAGGTGLGLSIVLMLARQMGGTAGVESAPGQGASFWFTLRAGVASASEAPGAGCARIARAPSSATPVFAGRVLVAEDVAANRLVVEAFLRRLGVGHETVVDGRAAVARAMDADRPALVLMDCNMPELDGIEATREIRRRERESGLARLPIVAMTARAFAEDRAACEAAGMDGFLSKPLRFDDVEELLSRFASPERARGASAASGRG
jgi:signal transduction histidine kinase/CheY-like chemotaxis protein